VTVLGPLEEKAAMTGAGFVRNLVSGGSIYPSGFLHDNIIAIKDVDGTIVMWGLLNCQDTLRENRYV